MRQYLYNVAIAFDRLGNAIIGGDPDWTISARMDRAINSGECRLCHWVCKGLALFDDRHCAESYKWHKDKR